jgi:hypothetical protein
MSHPAFGRSGLIASILVPLAIAAAPVRLAAQPGSGTVTLAVRAVAGDGQPVLDLKAGDVSLRVDGRPREIKSFEFVDLRPAVAPKASQVSPFPPPFQTNAFTPPDGRDVFVLVDEESITPGKDAAVKEAIGALISALSSRDRVGLVSVRLGGVNIGLTRDIEKVKSAVASLAGHGSARETAGDLRCRTTRTLGALQGLFSGANPAAPPTVVFFSTSVAAFQAGQMARMGAETTSEECPLRNEQFTELGGAAQASRAAFFVMELLDGGATPLPEAAGGLENFAGVTNGEFLRMGASSASQMARIAASTSAYYLVGFEPEAGDRGMNARRVEVSVARAGTTIRAPKELTLPKPAGKGPVTPRDMIRVATVFNDLPLRAAAYASRNPGDDKVRILALFEPVDRSVKLKSATIAIYDKAGNNKAQWNAQSEDFRGPTSIAALVVPAGDYRLRVASTDASGRPGTVDVPMSAALIEAGPIRLGDLVLGTLTETGPSPVLQFRNEAEALAMIELYGRPAGPLRAYVEVLKDPAAEPLQAVALTPSATSEQDKFVLSAKIPLGDLPPGDYMVRAVVGLEGQEGKITRTLRKTDSQ